VKKMTKAREKPSGDTNDTLNFYDKEAQKYPNIRARPLQCFTDALERSAILPYLQGSYCILDIGCGEGRLTRWMADETVAQGSMVVGKDFSAGMVEVAKQQNTSLNAEYAVGDVMALEDADNSYDLVISSTAPNNFPDLKGALAEIHRVLKPNGVFIGIIINKDESARFARYAYYAPYYLWRGLKRILHGKSQYMNRLYSQDEIRALLAEGYDIIELRGMRSVADWMPEYPLNFWKPLRPLMQAFITATESLDARLSHDPVHGKRARFHLAIAQVRK
jgi:demethylmenaquinone methyltransferase/2-methoxy-6-polyprenyl-1,4-benzoquinol methylase